MIKLGEQWPANRWVYILDGRWYKTTGIPTNEDGSSLRREEGEFSEEEANSQGIYRNVLQFKKYD